MPRSIKPTPAKQSRKPEDKAGQTKVLAVNGSRQATLARTNPKVAVVRFTQEESPANRVWCNASMPNVQPGYRWPHLATPPRG